MTTGLRRVWISMFVVALAWLAVDVGRAQAPAAAQAAGSVDTGTINGAVYRIEVPATWNRGLVMYAHGYQPVGTPPGNPDAPRVRAVRDVFLSRGFAFAESAYSSQGWAVKEGVEDTEALRRHFVATRGRPSQTFITGHSMGGHITVATIERYPDAYDGALPMCGPLGSTIDFFNNGLFDMLVTFEFLFPGTLGSPYDAEPDAGARVQAAIQAEPEKAARFATRFSRTPDMLPGALAFFQIIAAELKARAGGEPFDNAGRIYSGFGDDLALNRGVRRFAADPAARAYLRQYYSPTGRIADPVLALHTMADPLVLGIDVTAYELTAALASTSDLFVAKFVDARGHCAFTPAQTGAAFDALLEWRRTGARPPAGEIR